MNMAICLHGSFIYMVHVVMHYFLFLKKCRCWQPLEAENRAEGKRGEGTSVEMAHWRGREQNDKQGAIARSLLYERTAPNCHSYPFPTARFKCGNTDQYQTIMAHIRWEVSSTKGNTWNRGKQSFSLSLFLVKFLDGLADFRLSKTYICCAPVSAESTYFDSEFQSHN